MCPKGDIWGGNLENESCLHLPERRSSSTTYLVVGKYGNIIWERLDTFNLLNIREYYYLYRLRYFEYDEGYMSD